MQVVYVLPTQKDPEAWTIIWVKDHVGDFYETGILGVQVPMV